MKPLKYMNKYFQEFAGLGFILSESHLLSGMFLQVFFSMAFFG